MSAVQPPEPSSIGQDQPEKLAATVKFRRDAGGTPSSRAHARDGGPLIPLLGRSDSGESSELLDRRRDLLPTQWARHEVVRHLLGHRSIATTIRFYAGMKTAAALRHYDAVVLERRQEATIPEPGPARG
jgi:hypothetical protein